MRFEEEGSSTKKFSSVFVGDAIRSSKSTGEFSLTELTKSKYDALRSRDRADLEESGLSYCERFDKEGFLVLGSEVNYKSDGDKHKSEFLRKILWPESLKSENQRDQIAQIPVIVAGMQQFIATLLKEEGDFGNQNSIFDQLIVSDEVMPSYKKVKKDINYWKIKRAIFGTLQANLLFGQKFDLVESDTQRVKALRCVFGHDQSSSAELYAYIRIFGIHSK